MVWQRHLPDGNGFRRPFSSLADRAVNRLDLLRFAQVLDVLEFTRWSLQSMALAESILDAGSQMVFHRPSCRTDSTPSSGHPANLMTALQVVRSFGDKGTAAARAMPLEVKHTVHFITARTVGVLLRMAAIGHSKVIVLRIAWSPKSRFTVLLPEEGFEAGREYHFVFVSTAEAGNAGCSEHVVDILFQSIADKLRKKPYVTLRFVWCEQWPRSWCAWELSTHGERAVEEYCETVFENAVKWAYKRRGKSPPPGFQSQATFQSLAEYKEEWRTRRCPLFGGDVILDERLPRLDQ